MNDKGLLFSANVRFGQLETPFANTQAVWVDRQSRLWAGCQEGLFLQENGVFKKIFSQRENVISLWESPANGQIWVDTFGNGVFVVSPSGAVLHHFTERTGLANGSILSIGGNARQVWLATTPSVCKRANTIVLKMYQRPFGPLVSGGRTGCAGGFCCRAWGLAVGFCLSWCAVAKLDCGMGRS